MINLDIAGRLVAVVCHDAKGSRLLRAALADVVTERAGATGFVLQEPQRPGGLYVLVDRSGFVLSRTRTVEEAVSVLCSHLGVLLPPPADTVRLSMKALVGPGGRIALAAFPLFTSPAIVERRLERSGHRLLDRLVVDLTADGQVIAPPNPWHMAASVDVIGHTCRLDAPTDVGSVLLPWLGRGVPVFGAAVVSIASAMWPVVSHAERVRLAEVLACRTVVGVDLNKRSSQYETLAAVR